MKIKLLGLFFYLNILFLQAQVGIGTTDPKGILDVDSNTYGIIYPTVSLTATNIQAPVTTPDGSALPIGATVYNDNTTNTGSNDVKAGIYSWDGSKWITHFFKRQREIYTQSSTVRTKSNQGFKNITGIGASNNLSFTANFTGNYRISINANFGAGRLLTSASMDIEMVEGTFQFHFDGTDYYYNTKAFSAYNSHINGGTHYVNRWKETQVTEYVYLVAGQSYDFYLKFDQGDANSFENSGNSGAGRGYIGNDKRCFIEFTYIDE